MNRSTSPASVRVVLVLTVASLALAACGRKGGLDLPPQATVRPGAPAPVAAAPESDSASNKGAALFAPANGVDDGTPAATRGRKKPFLLDPLLD